MVLLTDTWANAVQVSSFTESSCKEMKKKLQQIGDHRHVEKSINSEGIYCFLKVSHHSQAFNQFCAIFDKNFQLLGGDMAQSEYLSMHMLAVVMI